MRKIYAVNITNTYWYLFALLEGVKLKRLTYLYFDKKCLNATLLLGFYFRKKLQYFIR